MQTKQIYIADTNHETVLLSEYEKEIISTKLFNRLHHISQNSTAYLTFPSNRTKRFEHSIGTMKLCGDIFYNAICNTSPEIIKQLFDEIEKVIINKIVTEKILDNADKYRPIIGDDNLANNGRSLKNFEQYDIDNIFYNRSIPSNLKEKQKFLYLIIFQSIRFCGLLHDIGHPPFSHITENSMNKIYQMLKKKENESELTKREKEYIEIIGSYNERNNDFQLHEKMGMKMIDKLFSQMLFSENLSYNKLNFSEKYFKIIVIELTKLIFKEENVLKPLHNIVAGTIDGDRLDYVNRDIANSGISNGKIEYNRLISSCKFDDVKIKNDKKLEVIYNFKTINTIEDFFWKRWYLYKNIINHHRVSKTDAILQNCIELIIKDYLSLKDGNSIEEENKVLPDDISGLWRAIKFAYSNNEYFDVLIQWDDNWLITVLKKYYFNDHFDKKEPLSYMLEEFLSNKKNYWSIIKNNNDFHKFSKTFEQNLDLTCIEMSKQYQKINEKYHLNYKNRKMHVIFAYLDSVFDEKIDIKNIMDKFIEKEYNSKIESFFIVSKKLKTGLDLEPIIYNFDETFSLSEFSNIKSILDVERSNYPYFYIYLKLKENDSLNKSFKERFLKSFGKYLADEVNEIIKNKLKEKDE
ncbi:HD domain-containing protein [Leptotrichia sp. oral taxon 417]|uniref:HD domain-containing protein n=1 Tax=Leptotrichia sp. oral taxon 417 TaxID=712365 RepID=UPI0015B80FD9|nr:HD domain-containing protein [Leptotrichia sp. oral taxon 417]NWO28294.1 HD domain-containing protein [Leptotrichia sp. oral taxon 417]